MAIQSKSTPRGVRLLRDPAVLGGGVLVVAVAIGIPLGIKHGVCINTLSGWVGLTVTGLKLGALYAMVALGYTMVYGVLQLLNFAHSEVFMIGSFAGLYALKKIFGIEATSEGVGGIELIAALFVAILVAALASGGVAVVMERVAYRPLRRHGAPRLAYLITAIGVSLFLSNLFLLLDGKPHLFFPFDRFNWPNIAGAAPVPYPNVMKLTTVFSIFGVQVHNLDILVFLVAIGMLVVLDLFVRKTRAGKGIRAVAEDPETASLMGVNVNGIIVLTFFVGGLMAGAAGVLYGLFFNAQFNMGFIPGLKAFTAAVLGGIGNIRGAMLGGLLLGLIENLGVACTGTQWQEVIAFLVLVGVLMFRPTGILGEQVGG